MKMKRLWRWITGNPCRKWMVCYWRIGCASYKPHPILCKFRYGEPSGYDFFGLFGPFETEREASDMCQKLIRQEPLT
jgi:hypothetical protein